MVLIEKGRRKLRQRQLYANFHTSSNSISFEYVGNFYIILRKTIHVIIKCAWTYDYEVSLLLVVERGEVGISTIRKINFCEVKEQSKTDEWICSIQMQGIIKIPMRVWVSITKVFNNSL